MFFSLWGTDAKKCLKKYEKVSRCKIKKVLIKQVIF